MEEVVTVSLAEMEEGELLDHEDHQNLILTNRRLRMVINKVGIKVFIKYWFFFSSARNKSRKSLIRLQILLNTSISVFNLINHPYRHIISKCLDNIRLSFR